MKKTLLKKDNYKNIATYLVVIVAFVIMQALSNQGKLGSAVTGYLVPVCCYIVLAVSLNLLVGVCGELSLGHAGFMGVGAFSGVVLATLLKDTVPSPVLRLILAMVFGGLLAGIIGGLIAGPELSAMADTVLRSLRDEPGYWWETYRRVWKRNARELSLIHI